MEIPVKWLIGINMPLIAYGCECGLVNKKFVRDPKDADPSLICPKCAKVMKKLLRSATFETKIVIDNGHQAKSVEVNPNIIEMNDIDGDKNYREES